MLNRPRYRRASASPFLLAVLAPLVALMAFRAAPVWSGIRMGASEQEIVSTLGEADSRDDLGGVVCLRYTDAEFWVREDGVYSITLRGDHAALQTRATLAMGLSIGEANDNIYWSLGDATAVLHDGTLSIHRD